MQCTNLHLVRAEDGHDHAGDELLRDVHKIIVVGVGHVELAGRELRVVRHVDALVTELLPDLVHTIDAFNIKEVLLFKESHVKDNDYVNKKSQVKQIQRY